MRRSATSVVDIFNIPSNGDELLRWSVLHMILHRSENQAVLQLHQVVLPEFVLDPIDVRPESAWFQQHQEMHDNVGQTIGVARFNLTDVNWADPAQRAGWFQSHAQVHQQETNILGVFA